MVYYLQGVTRLFNKYRNICNGSLLNSLVTPYIIHLCNSILNSLCYTAVIQIVCYAIPS